MAAADCRSDSIFANLYDRSVHHEASANAFAHAVLNNT